MCSPNQGKPCRAGSWTSGSGRHDGPLDRLALVALHVQSGVVDAQPVADARFGNDQRWSFFIKIDLLPQCVNIDSQVLNVGVLGAPNLPQDKSVSEYLAGMGHEQPQQFVFAWRQLYIKAPNGDATMNQIELQFTCLERRLIGSRLNAVALQDPDPR